MTTTRNAATERAAEAAGSAAEHGGTAGELGAEPSSTVPAADGDDLDGADGTEKRPVRPGGWQRVAAVAVLAALLLCSGGLLYARAELTDPAASGNRALTDTATTDQVIGDVSSALSEIFAYTPDGTRATEAAARQVLAGAAATQYQALFAQIRDQVAAQQLTLTTRVVRAGVVTLTAARARLLVFLDQTAQRAGSTATSAAAQLSVTAEYKGGHWRITELKAR